jgi:hypothetical protein
MSPAPWTAVSGGCLGEVITIYGTVPLSRETGFSPQEEGRDTKVVLLDPRYGL